MRYLLCGSFAYDTILLHAGRFDAHILPEALTRLNVCFGADSVRDEFGGTAGNIAYNAALIHQDTTLHTQPVWPVLAGSLGEVDAPAYLERLAAIGHDTRTLTEVPGQRCPHAWILTDERNNQITAFSPGAMAADLTLPLEVPLPELWHIAPEMPRNMCAVAAHAMAVGATFFFDPGQVLPALLDGAGEEFAALTVILERAQGIFVNDYEAALLEQKTGRPLASWISGPDQFVVRTLGGLGVELIEQSRVTHVSVAKPKRITDPTGCGDAFRAGFIHARLNGWSLADCARLGAAMGSFAVETSGGQNHDIHLEDLVRRLATTHVVAAPVAASALL